MNAGDAIKREALRQLIIDMEMRERLAQMREQFKSDLDKRDCEVRLELLQSIMDSRQWAA